MDPLILQMHAMPIMLQAHPIMHNLNDFLKKYILIVKSLFYKAKEKGKDLLKCLMIYHNIHLSGSLQSPVQILQSLSTISDLPLSKAARQQLGLQPEKLRTVNKNEHLPSHDLHIGQDVVYQDATSKQWYPATITSLYAQLRSYNITTREGIPTGRHKLT